MIFWMNKDPGMTSYDPKKCCMIKCRKLNSGVSNIKKEKRIIIITFDIHHDVSIWIKDSHVYPYGFAIG